MKKHLALHTFLRRKAAAAVSAALIFVTLSSTSFAASGALGRLLPRSPLETAFVSAPNSLRPVLAGLGLVAPQPQSNALNFARKGHTATRLPDGRVLVVGGHGDSGPLTASELFDPATRTFTPGASTAAARADHAALRLNDGRVLVTGGRDQNGPLASTEIYDPASGSFSAGPAMTRPRAGHNAVLLADGRVLLTGGDEEGTAEILDAQATASAPLDEPLYAARMGHSALLLKDGKVLVVGGHGPLGNSVQSAEIFDPAEETFSPIPGAMKVPRTRATLREMSNGLVQVVGGDKEGTIEIYVPATDDFQAFAHLPGTTPVADALSARTRSALFRHGQTDPALDRAAHTVTEIPQSSLALVAGGASTGGQILSTVSVVSSSTAAVTTDKIDYAPGELVTMTGTGFAPNETVSIVLHEEEAAHSDRTFTAVTDSAGNFTNTDFTPEAHHFGVHFVLTAKGQTSGFVAQTAFTDAGSEDIRVTLGSTARWYGQTTPPLRVNLCQPVTDGSGDCTPVNGKRVDFFVDGEFVGYDETSTKDVEGELYEGMAVVPYDVMKNAGAYSIVATFAGDEVYQADQGTATLTVHKAQTLISYVPTPSPISYGTPVGQSHVNATIKDNTTKSPFFGQPVAGSFRYTLTTLGNVPALGAVPNAGSNTIRADFTPADTVNYPVTFRNGSFSVSKALLTITPNNVIRLYGQPNPTLTGTITGLVNNDQIFPVYTTTATQSSTAGTYNITFSTVGAGVDPGNKLRNYTLTTPAKVGTLAVNKAPLTLTAHDKTRPYGADNPALTFEYSGFVLNETASVLTGSPSISTTATAASEGGTYPITLALGTLSSPNYEFTLRDATMTVTKAQSVLNLSGLTQTYDGTPKAVTVTTDPPNLSGVSVSYSLGNMFLINPTDAAQYFVTARLDHPGYEAETVTGTLVINKAEQVITFAPVGDRTFGDAPFALSATASSGLPVKFQVVSGPASVSGNTVTLNGAGTVVVAATQDGDSNRNPAPVVTQPINVAKGAATINFDPAGLARTYTGEPQSATVTTTPAGLSGLGVTYTRDGAPIASPTDAGEYAVTATLDNPNYAAAAKTATLVIAPATVSVNLESASYVFDGMQHPVKATVSGGGQNPGTLTYNYTPQGNVGPDTGEPPVGSAPPSQPGTVPPAPAYTTLNDPPSAPRLITVFPERDFVSAENYTASDGQVTINVLRRDPATGALVTVGSATATPGDDPTTPQFDGIFEVNHPGGSCWIGSTPNIRPGDIVRVTNSSGVADQTTVARVSATRPVQINANTVRISGRAVDASGNPLPLAQIEQRLISSSNDPFALSGRRDLRAPGNGTLVYDDPEDPTHWTATYTNLSADDVARALRVESRILWLGSNPAAENELTIFEIGDGVFGGPQAPCAAPAEDGTPAVAFPPPPAPAYTTLQEPPTGLHLITVFPERDFVSIENYAAADGPVTINVLRRVNANGTTTLRTVGSATAELQDDPTTSGFDGLAEVNHPGGACWVGSTPDIRPGDIVRVTTRGGAAEQTTVSNVVAERAEQLNASTVVVRGTAQDANGNPLPIDQLEQRMISSSADRFNVNGRRDIRAVSTAGEEVGTLVYDAPGSIHWTATYTNLGSQDVARALRSETRILWLGRDPAAENELTIFEIGDEVFGGPQAPCSAPREGLDVPVYVGVYDVSVSLAGNPNYRVAANAARITITKATPTVTLNGGPFRYDGAPHPATVAVTGIAGKEFVPPSANTTVTYSLNGSTPTTDPPVAPGSYTATATFAGSRNYKEAANTAPHHINNNAPVAEGVGEDVNYALASQGATVVASSQIEPKFPASGAINGDHKGLNWEAGGGWNDSTRDVWPDWLQVEFNGSKTINEVRVYTLQNNFTNPQEPTPDMTATDYGLIDFDVQYWDGSQWVTVPGGAIRGNDRVMRIVSGFNITTTKIRVYVLAARNHYSRIVEVEAFGGPPAAAATDEDKPVSLTLKGTDADGNPLTFALVNNPTHGRLSALGAPVCATSEGRSTCTATATYTPDANYHGTDSFTFKANDTQSDSNVAKLTINVNPVNDAPQTNAGPDATINEGGNFTGGGSFSDVDDAGPWTATVNYGDGSGVQPLPLNPDKTFALSHVYKDNAATPYTVTVTVTDNAGASSSDTAVVTVVNVAPTPAITGAPTASPEGTPITLGSTVSDPSEVDTAAGFKYLWTVTKNGAPYAQSAETVGLSAYTFTPDEDAPYAVTLRVTDKNGAASTTPPQSITVTNVENNDDFNDNTTDTAKWTVSTAAGLTVVEQNQRLEITPAASSTGYGGYVARNAFNLTNSRATVEVIQGTVGYGIETYFHLANKAVGGTTDMLFTVGGAGSLLMRERFNGTITSQTVIPYDAAQHRFWRFRHDPATNTMKWETSGDGLAWTARHSATVTVNLTKMQASLSAGKYTATTPTMAAVFDNYRAEPNPVSPDILADDFNDNSTNTSKWTTVLPTNMALSEQNQRLEITTPSTGTGYGGYYSAAYHNLTGGQAAVEVVQPVSGHGADTYFVLHDMTTNRNAFYIAVGGVPGSLLLQETFNGVAGARVTIPFDAAQHRFWRFRHDTVDGMINWETSPDGLAWTTRLATPHRFDITKLQARIYAGRYSTTTPASVAVFDNFRMERLKTAHTPPSDYFNDNLLDTSRWTTAAPGSPTTAREQNQRLEVALAPNTIGHNGVSSASAFNFWNKTMQVEVPQTASLAGGVQTYYMLWLDDNNSFSIAAVGGNGFNLDSVAAGVRDRTQLIYSAAQHRFWRLRHNAAAHTMNFEVSGDGNAWTTVKTVKVTIPIEAMKVVLVAGASGTGNSDPGTAVFDNLKLYSNE